MKRFTEPHANARVPARVYDVEGGAIFAKNSTFVFFDGFAWTPRLRSPSPIMVPAQAENKGYLPFTQKFRKFSVGIRVGMQMETNLGFLKGSLILPNGICTLYSFISTSSRSFWLDSYLWKCPWKWSISIPWKFPFGILTCPICCNCLPNGFSDYTINSHDFPIQSN